MTPERVTLATSKQRERDTERYLRDTAKKHAGMAEKFTSPSKRSVPDRVCTLPCFEPHVQYVEVKAEGKEPTDAQARDHKKRRAAGGIVHVIDTKQGVDDFFHFNCNGICELL